MDVVLLTVAIWSVGKLTINTLISRPLTAKHHLKRRLKRTTRTCSELADIYWK